MCAFSLLATLSLALSGVAAPAVAAVELAGCAYVGERNVTLYSDASYVHLWNYVATRIANSLADDLDTDKILDDRAFDMRTGLVSLASRHQPRLNNAWYTLTTLIIVVLILLPVLVMSRMSVSRIHWGFLRKLLALPARTDSITWYTASTAAFASLITLFYIFQICSSLGAENAVDIMHSKTWEIRKDMRTFLNSMNCEEVAASLNNLVDSANKTDTQAKDVLLTHEIAYPGFLGMHTDPFQAGRRRLRLVTFVTSLIVVVFVLSLAVTIALGISMRHPETMPAEKSKFSNFAGLAILLCLPLSMRIPIELKMLTVTLGALFSTAYGALPASAVLLVIGRNLMNLSVAAQAFICNPYSKRNPSLVDHDIGRVRRKLLSGPTATAYRHSDADLSSLMQYAADFRAYVDEERQRISIKFVGYITSTLATGGDALAAKVTDIIEKSYRNIVRKKILRLEAAFSGVRTNAIAALGHCDELKQAYDSGVSLMCNVILSNANGFWVALVIISLLLTCASFTSMRLSRQCLKMTRREAAVSEDEPVGHSLKESCHSVSSHIHPKVVTGREECGDFRGASSTPDDDLDVTVVGSVQSNRFYGDSVEADHAFRT
ncbi:hypothetical protein HPB50_003493 [Hyalomma asiaticum]|uniref:Uncharacterized protein n=1 Tax=Hyalomma asiaticum TaxID=266040 RepID=A0ACB7SM40_HYAAI|nr:hypothetical protein HPB50_003493 [Hyalomma asiaticum]